MNVLHHNNIVFLPSKETNELIGEFSKDKAEITSNHFPSYKGESIYFEIRGKPNEKYLYKYYYIECKAIKTTIPNSSNSAFKLNIIYNKSISNLVCYFAYDTVVLQPLNSINSKIIVPFDINKSISSPESGNLPHKD